MLRATRFAMLAALLSVTAIGAAQEATPKAKPKQVGTPNPTAKLKKEGTPIPKAKPKSKVKPTAVTDLKDVDADFAYQGEYLGSVLNKHNCCQSVGLQVVALGGGQFQAVEYTHGLPGYGWKIGRDRTKYTGKLEDETLTLDSEGRQISISNGYAIIRATGGRTLGHANKVHRESSTMGAAAPHGSAVLFDGTNTDKFKDGKIVDGNLLKEGTETAAAYGDFRLHLEFRLPYMPHAKGQARANSGVYVQGRYEVQILDSFGLDGEFNECGALYRERKPDLNMCLPPLTWQTYDIWFRGPRFDEAGKKTEHARFTVLLNGVPVQDDIEQESGTGNGKRIGEGTNPRPTKFQNHSNPVRFRNMWLVEGSGKPASHCCPHAQAAIEKADPQLLSLLKTIGYRN